MNANSSKTRNSGKSSSTELLVYSAERDSKLMG